MRYASVLILLAAATLSAQTADSDPRLIQTLISEVRELRLAIERSTLLGSRTQLAISRLQLQQNAAAQAARDLDNLRRDVAEMSARRSTIEKEMKNAEEEANSAKPEARTAIQQAIAQLKLNLEAISGEIDRGAAREAELNRKVGELQAQVSDAESRIGQMERSLDEAIQQMLKPR